MVVIFKSLTILFISVFICDLIAESRLLKGSSNNKSGSRIIALAIATLCCSSPESYEDTFF